MNFVTRLTAFATLALTVGSTQVVMAADHADTPLLRSIGRHDARITDLHAFVRGTDLVVALSTNAAIPAGVTDYIFPSDVEFKIKIDNESEVSFENADDTRRFGGTVEEPDEIEDEIEIEIEFNANGEMEIDIDGMEDGAEQLVRTFAGLRDDPFIRTPRNGRNIAAIVVQIPLSAILDDQSTILVWATAEVDDLGGEHHELGGLSLVSQFPEGDALNAADPSRHVEDLGFDRPDVIIYDTSRPADFPNGRDLIDDVVTEACTLYDECRAENTDAPFPTENDVPFLQEFPYLAPPQIAISPEV